MPAWEVVFLRGQSLQGLRPVLPQFGSLFEAVHLPLQLPDGAGMLGAATQRVVGAERMRDGANEVRRERAQLGVDGARVAYR